MGCFDTGLVRYGTLVVGYGLCSLPYLGIWLFHVKGPGGAEYIKNKDIGKLTRDYVRNSNLLIDLAAAIGRIIVSYKNV
jgi:ATP-binding cassette subfamily D (ALD) protein 3